MGGNKVALYQQLLFAFDKTETSHGELGTAAIITELKASPEEVRLAILPLLPGASGRFKSILYEGLEAVDRIDVGKVNFDHYLPIVKREQNGQRAALIEYLYTIAPETAAPLITRSEIDDPATVAELNSGISAAEADFRSAYKLKPPENIAQIVMEKASELSENPHWWIRLYVAAKLNKALERNAKASPLRAPALVAVQKLSSLMKISWLGNL